MLEQEYHCSILHKLLYADERGHGRPNARRIPHVTIPRRARPSVVALPLLVIYYGQKEPWQCLGGKSQLRLSPPACSTDPSVRVAGSCHGYLLDATWSLPSPLHLNDSTALYSSPVNTPVAESDRIKRGRRSPFITHDYNQMKRNTRVKLGAQVMPARTARETPYQCTLSARSIKISSILLRAQEVRAKRTIKLRARHARIPSPHTRELDTV